MKRQKSIRRKIITLLLGMVLSALLLTGGVSLFSLYAMRKISEENSIRLGQTAAEDAETALEEMSGERLLAVAKEKAAYIEEKFHTVIACVNGIAEAAEKVYENPQNYPDREVPLPVKGSKELAVQLLWSERLNYESGQLTEEEKEELLKLGNLQELLVQYNANNDMISSAYLASESGWMLQADDIPYRKYSGASDLPDFYEADTRQWYQKACQAEKGQCVYTDVMTDVYEGTDCIVCARAVWAKGEIVAVAGIGSYLDTVNETVLNTTVGESGYAFLVNEKGQIIISGKAAGEEEEGNALKTDLRNSKNTALAKAAEEMTKGGSGLVQLPLKEREVYLAYAPLKELGWSFVTVIDVEEVIKPAKESQQDILSMTKDVSRQQNAAIRKTISVFLGIMAMAAIIIGIIGVLFAGRLTAPIRILTKEAAHIEGGNLCSNIRIATGDEIEELGNAFNSMTLQLQQYIKNLASVTAERERIQTELLLAAKIQADMLPDSGHTMQEEKEFCLYASMTPAKEVGGDFYDFFLTDEDHLVIITADVSGKGVPASLFMVVARTLFRSRITGEDTLAEAVTEVNKRLCEGNKSGMFVTAWIGMLTLSTGVMTYVNAGHNPPLIKSAQKKYTCLKERSGFVLAGMEDVAYRQKESKLSGGDMLFLYTDGVTEANDEKGSLYGEERLLSLADSLPDAGPRELAGAVWEDVQHFQGNAEQFDDITMLALYYRGNECQTQNGQKQSRQKQNTGPADLARQDLVQSFVEESLTQEGLSPTETRRFLIACDEIFSNVCRYGKAKEVTVKCYIENDSTFLIIEDDGMAFNPLKRQNPNLEEAAEKRKAGGLGIYMVRKLMDEVMYERIGGINRLIMKKKTETI